MVDGAIVSFFLKYKFIIIFYLVIIALVYWKRKKIQSQAKIIMLYRTKFGLKAMDKFVAKYREWVILIGYIGVGAGYVGLIVISFVLIQNLYNLIFVANAASGVSLVLPGVNVPGLGILPFWYWLIAIFLIALIHEFGHGIVARAHKIPVHNTGLVLFGPIIGAFVEPDEKKMSKKRDIVQYSVMAAGPFANIILAIVAVLLLNFAFIPLQDAMVDGAGFSFTEYVNDTYPAALAELQTNTLITGIDGVATNTFQEFGDKLFCKSPGEKIVVSSFDKDGVEKEYNLTLATNPDDENKAFLGIIGISNEVEVKEEYKTGIGFVWFNVVDWLVGFLRWLFILSLGIGLFNLLPLPIVDGGRMMQVTMRKVKGKEKGDKRYHQIGMFFLFVLLLNLFWPLIKRLFGFLF